MDCLQSFRYAVRQVAGAERRKTDLLDRGASLADCGELPHQRMCRVDFIVSVRANHEQMREILLDQPVLQKVERCRIEPLQNVQKQCQRMLWARENAQKPPKCKVRASFLFLSR